MLSDLKHALRSLLKSPGFTVVVLLTLALGVGATISIFSVVNAVLLRPLPYVQPDRLALLHTKFPTFARGEEQQFPFSRVEYLDLHRETKSWQSLEAWANKGANIATATEPMRVTTAFVTGGFLSSLGAATELGRIITPLDDTPKAPLVAVISNGLWQRAFGSDHAVLGRDILLNGRKCTVVGVMPKTFRFAPEGADEAEVWTPLQIDPVTADNDVHDLVLLGRLKHDITLRQAQAELDTLIERWGRTASGHHFDPKEHTIATYFLPDEMVKGSRSALRMLFGAACFLLLIACVNVVNLLLARAQARLREIAIRDALGAGVWHIASQFMAEGFLLACAGAALGLLFTMGSLRLIESVSMVGLPQGVDFTIDGHVLLFAIVLSVSIGFLFALAPLIHILKRNLSDAMKSTATATTDAVGAQRFRQALVVCQLALALILLTGTGLMLRASWNLSQVATGIDPKGVFTMSTALPQATRNKEAQRFWRQLEERLVRLPGAQSAALSTTLVPVFKASRHLATHIEGFAAVKGGPIPYVPTDIGLLPTIDFYQFVTPGYFAALRIRRVAGRFFDERDGAQAPRVAIINETMARMFWGSGNAVGHRIRPDASKEWYNVIGIVADVKNDGLDRPAAPQVYLTPMQVPDDIYDSPLISVHVVVRAQGDPLSIASAVRRAVHEINPALPLADARQMQEVVSSSRARPQFLTLLLSLFAGIALVLSTVGIYGIVSYTVSRRTKEVGVRMALGAGHGDVLGLVLRNALILVFCGVSTGLAGAFATTRLLSGFLFDITATDPLTFVAVSVFFSVVAIIASYFPARRATQVDPLIALRAE